MAKTCSLPRGTADILPDESHQWFVLERHIRNIFSQFGFREIRTPYFEEKSLFARSLGDTSEVVNKQLLELKGEGKDSLALRPEGTAGVVRAYIEQHLHKKETLTKVFYIGPMFRGERPQKGRLRQFHQFGAEVIGPQADHPMIDAEIIALSVQILKVLGWKSPKLLLNTLGSLEDKANLAKSLRSKLEPFASELGEEDRDRLTRNVFRVLDSKNKATQAVIKRLEIGHEDLSEASRAYFQHVKDYLTDLDIEFTEVPTLVRGLDYYTHTVFEIVDDSLGSQNALGAGGRYDKLVAQLGGPDIPAVGFAFGIERILMALPKELAIEQRLDAYMVAIDESALPKAFHMVHELRRRGVSCDMAYRVASVKSLMRSADKSGARFVIILGEEEIHKKYITFKDLSSGNQQRLPLDEIDGLTKAIVQGRKDAC